MERPPRCPDCNRDMEPGFILDHGQNAKYRAAWVAGFFEWSRWSGGAKLKGREKLPVTTFRCPRCARLMSFAHPGKWPG